MAASFVDTLPSREEVGVGQLYRYSKGAAADCLGKPAVNESNMSVRMRISTDCIDRERMVIRQEGIDLSLYRPNPVVLFGHGEEGICTPVAMSEDEDGECTVFPHEDGTYAIAFHKSADKTSSQIFDAVKCGLLRASSVGVTPKDVSVRYDKANKKIPVVEGCYLNEWSYCAVGVNPEALIKSHRGSSSRADVLEAYALQCDAADRILTANKLDGSAILPEIRKSLLRLAPNNTVYSRGVSAMPSKLTRVEIRKMTAAQIAKSLLKMQSYDMDTQKMLKEEVKMMDEEDTSMEEEVEDDDDDDDDDDMSMDMEMDKSASEPASSPSEDTMLQDELAEDTTSTSGPKQGSTVLTALHEDLSGLLSKAESSLGSTENERVVKGVEKEIGKIRDCLMSIEALHNGEYPDSPKLGGGDEVDVTESVVKSWLNRESRNRRCLSAISNRLDVLSSRIASGRVRRDQLAKSLKVNARDLNRIAKAAENYDGNKDTEEKLAKIEQRFMSLLEKLDNSPA